MKKTLLLTIFCLGITLSLSAQKSETTLELPLKDDVIFFENVVQVDSTFSKKQLFAKGREWFVNYYKSANDVLQMDDKEEGVLIGKGLHKYNFFNGINSSSIALYFTVNLTVKDGKYRYQIYNFNGMNTNRSALDALSSTPSGPTVSEVNFDTEYKNLLTEKSRAKYRTKLLSGLQNEVLLIVTSLEKAMKGKSKSEF